MAMSAPLKKITALLEKGTTEEAIAAAVVLGALAPREGAVVRALGKQVTRRDNLPLALASARALGAIGNPAALKQLLPLLEAEGELRDTGAMAIAGCGKAALPAVKQALAKADVAAQGVLIRILARMHTADALRLVLATFLEDNFELVKIAGRTLRAEVPSLSAAERKAAAKTTLTFLRSKPVQASRAATSSTLIYLGALAQPETVTTLLRYTGPKHTPGTRKRALQAVRHTLLERPVPAKVVETVFPYLDDPNYEAVVEPALGILDPASLPSRFEKELKRHLGARFPRVQQFAVRKLAASTTRAGAETLVTVLDGTNEMLRRSALHALKQSPRAPALLFPRLLKEQDADKAWELVHLMKPQAAAIKPAESRKLGATAVKALDKRERRAEPLLHLFRHADGKTYYKTFFDRAMKAKRARKYAEAERALRMITKSPHFDAEARFQLSLLMLKAAGSPPSPTSPKCRQALEAFRRLHDEPGVKFEARLKKEARALGPEGMYAVGFGLIEGRGKMKALGAKLLQAQVKKGPRSKTGKMARAKLETEGWA